jgi:hypothetical protein
VADLTAQWIKKGKEELHSFCHNTKWDRRESYFERYYRNGLRQWFHDIKMNCRVFVPKIHTRAGHSSLKASLSRFNIVSTTECECGDRLQMEKHIFWDCKLYGDERATMMDILSENSKKEHPKSVTELLRLQEKRFVQDIYCCISASCCIVLSFLDHKFSVYNATSQPFIKDNKIYLIHYK